MFSVAVRSQVYRSATIRRFADAVAPISRKPVSMEQRAANRAARKERATKFLAQARGTPVEGADSSSAVAVKGRSVLATRWVWYLGVAVPTALLVWGYNDDESPPAKVSKSIGLTDWITSFTDQYAQPSHEKLLPDWSQVSMYELKKYCYCFEKGSITDTTHTFITCAQHRCQMFRRTFPFLLH